MAWKGLCSGCYRAAKQLVESGESSWDDLARMGLARLDPPTADKFRKAFEAATKGKK